MPIRALTLAPAPDYSIILLNKRKQHGRAKARIYDQLARIGRALGSRSRFELLEMLGQGELSVEILARHAGLSIANASQHLRVLREAGLVEGRKSGLFVYYRVASPQIITLVESLRRLGQGQLAEVDRLVRSYFSHDDDLEPVGRAELLERVTAGTVTVLDVRSADEYRAGHVRGAISIPLRQLERRMAELPTDQEIVAYCRGPYCVLSCTAVDLLRAKGLRARRLADGFPEWWAHGFPIEAGRGEGQANE